MDNIDKKIEFMKELEKFKLVERMTYKTNGSHENDAEHSWNLAMMIIVFREELKEYDYHKMLEIAIVHDLVELYAGDTFAYDEEAKKTKKKREEESLKRILAPLPEPLKSRMKNTIEDYEHRTSKEAQVVGALDKLLPIILNIVMKGKTWKEQKITYNKVIDYKRELVEKDPLAKELLQRLCNYAKEKKIFYED